MALPLAASPLEGFLWKHRLLVLAGTDTAQVRKQQSIFEEQPQQNAERQLRLIMGDKAVARAVELDLASPFAMVLVGKDGTVKQRYSSVTPMERIYARIDTMPMRKREMRRKTSEDR